MVLLLAVEHSDGELVKHQTCHYCHRTGYTGVVEDGREALVERNVVAWLWHAGSEKIVAGH